MKYLPFVFLLLGMWSCETAPATNPCPEIPDQTAAARIALQRHLDAVSGRDLATLRATLSPVATDMQLILPGAEISRSVDSFLVFHEVWFEDTTWTFETEILDVVAGSEVALGTTQVIYREPERNGEPYFNRMIVTYGLRRVDGTWYVISDHASSVEKSTDG